MFSFRFSSKRPPDWLTGQRLRTAPFRASDQDDRRGIDPAADDPRHPTRNSTFEETVPVVQFWSIPEPRSTSAQRDVVTRFPLPPSFSTMSTPISEIGRKASLKGSEAVAIYIFCPSCKGSFKVRDEYAGKQGVCPKCGHVIRIASSTSETQRGVPRPATRAQKEEGRRLGIEFDERITYVDLKKKIEAAQAAKPTDDAHEGRD
jgi:predicted Zn finger-like uncharacterized protein